MDNAKAFHEAYGSAFPSNAAFAVKEKELHVLKHDLKRGILEDVAVLGATALSNTTMIGRPTEVVAPDGACSTVTARWDGDVWVEVDDCLTLETRRWLRGNGDLVVVRTATREDGKLASSTMVMRAPTRAPPVLKTRTPPPSDGMQEAAEAIAAAKAGAMKEDNSTAASLQNAFARLFGSGDRVNAATTSNDGAAGASAAAEFFNLDAATTPLVKTIACSLEGTRGHLYVFNYEIAFGALGLEPGSVAWTTPGKAVNELELTGNKSLLIGTTTGDVVTFEGIDDVNKTYDALVDVLDSVPLSPAEEVHGGDPAARVTSPIRVGFDPEQYVIVHVAQAGYLPSSALGSVPMCTAALGRFGASTPAQKTLKKGAPCAFDRAMVFPATECDLAADSLSLSVAAGGGLAVLGEANLPLAALYRGADGGKKARKSPFTMGLVPPGSATGVDATSPLGVVGELTVTAWIGTYADVVSLGENVLNAEPGDGFFIGEAWGATEPTVVRTPPPVCRVTAAARAVRGVARTNDLRCEFRYGDFVGSTPAASNTPSTQAAWGEKGAVTFAASEPRSGVLTVDVVSDDGKIIGRASVELAALKLRPKLRGKSRQRWMPLRKPPSSAAPSSPTSMLETIPREMYNSLFGSGEETSEDASEGKLGEILLEAFVDEACGPTASIGRDEPLGTLSLEIIRARGLTPPGRERNVEPSAMLEINGVWVYLPAGKGVAPPAWRREIVAAIYDAGAVARIGVFDGAEDDEALGFVDVPVARLPRGYPMQSTLALKGGVAANDNAEITIRAMYTPAASTLATLAKYVTPAFPRSAYAHAGVGGRGDLEELKSLAHRNVEEGLLSGASPLLSSMVYAMLPPDEDEKKALDREETPAMAAAASKAHVVRIAAALSPFEAELSFLSRATSWESPIAAGLLHVMILGAIYHPWMVIPKACIWLAFHAICSRRPTAWTLLGPDKSTDAGSSDIGAAPPGSALAGVEAAETLGEAAPPELIEGVAASKKKLSGGSEMDEGVAAAAAAMGLSPRPGAYEACVQFAYWTQATTRRVALALEALHDLLTWVNPERSSAFMVACFATAGVLLFMNVLRPLLVMMTFVALRHPAMWKPKTLPFELALAEERRRG